MHANFKSNLGIVGSSPLYPYTRESALVWLEDFLKQRFEEFGPYEDAIEPDQPLLHHSLLSPMLNVGLLTPEEVLTKSLFYAARHAIPLNSTEGFVRQILGWREFMRGVYLSKGRQLRVSNFWQFQHPMPKSFYEGTTGLLPVDSVIHQITRTGYCHHIERLMVLGNAMLLCEIHPEAVYRWFMEFFIDAYDWVMVPNVYGMSQFADGGKLTTKPYFSGSNYLMKMGHYPKGEWQATWDALFWRFMHVHRDFFLQNYRMRMLVRMFDKMPDERRATHLSNAASFLKRIHS